jgi:hypothetical protein
MDRVEQGWIGIDAGKGHHHAVLIDRDGQRLLSRRVINDQADLVALIDTVQDRVVDPVWAIDLVGGSASLVIALLLQRGQRVVYLPGIAVNRATAGYRGKGKPMPRTPPSSPIRPGCGAICASYTCWMRTSLSFNCCVLIVPIWPPTAPEASTGSGVSSPASFLPWNACWTSPTAAR